MRLHVTIELGADPAAIPTEGEMRVAFENAISLGWFQRAIDSGHDVQVELTVAGRKIGTARVMHE